MTTSPDTVSYPQSIAELVGPTEAAPWSSSLRPTNPWVGLFGFAEDLIDFEFWDGIEWLHPIWAERNAHFLGNVTIDGTLNTHGYTLMDGTHLSAATTGSNTLQINRPGLTGAASANNFWAFKSAISLTDTTHPAGVHFNSFISTNVLANAEPGEVWGLMSRIYTGSSTLSSNAVAFYAQAERDAVLPSGVGVPLLGAVIETRSGSGAGAATDGIIQGLEIDIAANGAVTPTAYRQFMVFLGKRGVAGGSNMEVSNLISVVSADGNPWSFEKGLRLAANVTYKEAVIDTRLGTEGTGAAIVWGATGQHIFLNTAGTAQLSGNAAGAVVSSKSFVTGLDADTDATSTLNAAASTNRLHLYTAAGTRVWSNGATTTDAWVVGRYVGGVFQESSLSIANATGDITVAKGLNVTGVGTFSARTQVVRIDSQPGTVTWSGTTTSSASLNPFRQTGTIHTGTSTNVGGQLILNLMNIGTDSIVAATASKVVGWQMNHNVGAGAVGTRNGFQYYIANTGITTTDFLTAGTFSSTFSFNAGGVANSFAGAKGDAFGLNTYATVGASATFIRECVSYEANIQVVNTAGVFRKAGIQVVPESTDAGEGLSVDAGYLVGCQTGARGFQNLFQAGAWGSQWPINQTPTFPTSIFRAFSCVDYNSVGQAVTRGIDLLEATISDVAFRSQGFAVNGSGAVQIGTGLIEAISGGLKVGAPGSLGTGTPTVSAAGTGYAVEDLLYDAYGGVYRVATIAGSGVATVSVKRQPYVPGATPANPVATTTWQTTGLGTGCTLTLTWTAGGNVTIGTGSAVATNATTGMLKIPTCAGIPTGVVGGVGGATLICDSTNHKVYCNDGGGWFALN